MAECGTKAPGVLKGYTDLNNSYILYIYNAKFYFSFLVKMTMLFLSAEIMSFLLESPLKNIKNHKHYYWP